MKPLVIGIAGASCSGKTKLAEAIAARLAERETVVISLDSYYHDLSHLPLEERARWNFDDPEAIDFELLTGQLRALLEGEGIKVPRYLFQTHTRAPEDTTHVYQLPREGAIQPVVILEGLHTLYHEELRSVIDLGVYIETRMDVCLARRIERDVTERGRQQNDIIRQFEETVVPMHRRYVEPVKQYADLVVDGEAPLEESAACILELLPHEGDERGAKEK